MGVGVDDDELMWLKKRIPFGYEYPLKTVTISTNNHVCLLALAIRSGRKWSPSTGLSHG